MIDTRYQVRATSIKKSNSCLNFDRCGPEHSYVVNLYFNSVSLYILLVCLYSAFVDAIFYLVLLGHLFAKGNLENIFGATNAVDLKILVELGFKGHPLINCN